MSYSNLLKIIKEFDLYPEMRKKYPIEEVIEKMRKDIKLETINAELQKEGVGDLFQLL